MQKASSSHNETDSLACIQKQTYFEAGAELSSSFLFQEANNKSSLRECHDFEIAESWQKPSSKNMLFTYTPYRTFHKIRSFFEVLKLANRWIFRLKKMLNVRSGRACGYMWKWRLIFVRVLADSWQRAFLKKKKKKKRDFIIVPKKRSVFEWGNMDQVDMLQPKSTVGGVQIKWT